ncbi:MAG TPA: DUF1501 domain-containing protein, partial [Prosthecobacter sp.]|nr:DUF1501 domain-containing protein [Prosthecobacter sp.]
MSADDLSPAGHRLLGRRGFLQNATTGIGAIALSSLLQRHDAMAAAPIRPVVRADNPLHARAPHFEAKAKRVLVIFCSGACSHLESWDWKPELARMDGKPMPGAKDSF